MSSRLHSAGVQCVLHGSDYPHPEGLHASADMLRELGAFGSTTLPVIATVPRKMTVMPIPITVEGAQHQRVVLFPGGQARRQQQHQRGKTHTPSEVAP